MHAGLSPATPIFDYQDGYGQYGYNPNIAGDAAGAAMLAWYSSGSRAPRCARTAGRATGAPVAGGAATMPGTGGMRTGMIGLTPLVGAGRWRLLRGVSGGPEFLGRNIMLWRIGDGSARRIARTSRPSPAVTLAATADGRLWIAWVDADACEDTACWRRGRTPRRPSWARW